MQNIEFGEPIHDPDEVEDRLRRAQKAILNPSTPVDQFLEAINIGSMETELSFSPNFVSVAISGPNAADLSFCDLPGTYQRRTETLSLIIISYRPYRECDKGRS